MTKCILAVVMILSVQKLFAGNLVIDDPAKLQTLEAQGFDFSRIAFGGNEYVNSNATLYQQSKSYRVIVDSLERDLVELKKKDQKLSTTMSSAHRLFDIMWLKRKEAKFELVGVVNRIDRSDFEPASCGEIRFIYRLAYMTTSEKTVYSRLPMTLNVVFLNEKTVGCRAIIKAWQDFEKQVRPADLKFDRSRLKSVEVNLQAVRWPSTTRPDFGGYAEYFLRVFHPHGENFVLSGLENSPDVPRINADKKLKAKLLSWLKQPENLEKIDLGIADVPMEFLADRGTSVALLGLHRLANAPFSQIFSEEDFADVPFKDRQSFQSAHGLLRRLNDLSCVGCHQGRTIAGFHFLGKDRESTDAVNSILISASPHFMADQGRRMKYIESLMQGKIPSRYRSTSLRAEGERGDFGSHCGLGDQSFKNWDCSPGFKCMPLVHDLRVSRTGICMPERAHAGSVCQVGRMAHNSDPHKDRVIDVKSLACSSGDTCESVSVGFPGGMCSGGCDNLSNEERCGNIAVLLGFNQCLVGKRKTFASCLSENVRPGSLMACSLEKPCRDDYICVRGTDLKIGTCIPPYFLFQLRVDGHPVN